MRMLNSRTAIAVMQCANKEAMHDGSGFIGSEHILVGLIEEPDGVAGQVLRSLGVDEAKTRQAYAVVRSNEAALGQLSEARELYGQAVKEAERLYHTTLDTEHLLLAILNDPGCRAFRAIAHLRLDADQIRAEIGHRSPSGDPSRVARPKAMETQFQHHPQVVELKGRINDLQEKLERSVSARDFETAASCRDDRRDIEQRLIDLYFQLGSETAQ
jgi:ATP-dependent Clp protease ATP-binding subunit ClpA